MDSSSNRVSDHPDFGYERIDRWNDEKTNELAKHYTRILELIGEDPKREGLEKTPLRVAKAIQFITQGYNHDPVAILQSSMFREDYQQMVLVKDIEIFSMCEHHMLPFYGRAHIAYIPSDKVIGLSKIPRLVDMFARRLQVQERLTQEIAETLQQVLNPRGVGVICEARHLCMMMRGVEKQHSGAVTSAMLGAFRERGATREELLSLVAHNTLQF